MRKDIKDYTLDDVWTVEGKHYDFTDFAPRHPGGETFLMVGKGRECTELFKSVHQLSDVNFEKLFAKYEVELFKKDLPSAASAVKQFDFSTKSVFYHELRTAVKNYFQSKNLSHKATWNFWGIFTVYLFTMLYLVFKTVTERSLIISVLAGIMVMFFGFCIMHTGSHGGLSSNGFVNWILFATYCNCLGWFHHVWLQHHVYGHHSYTGLVGKDPDCTNVPVEISRKSALVEFKPLHKYNKYIETFILCVFPSQFVAQAMDYFATLWNGHVFGMRINGILTPQDVATTVVQFSVWFLTFVVTPIYMTGLGHLFYTFVFYLILGIFYWAFVETNHDTYEVHVNSVACGGFHSDWAAHQIIQSSNFAAPWLLTFLIGGMNYQIEHHLFPSVHPVHYPEISKIVRTLCKKHNIPYVMHGSWLEATISHFKFLDHFSKPDAK